MAELNEQLRVSWSLDSNGIIRKEGDEWTPEEKIAVEKAESSRRFRGDRYEVALPWKASVPDLPDNRKEAEKRHFSLERSLIRRGPDLTDRYRQDMQVYISKRYIRKLDGIDESGWYLPHFAVFRRIRIPLSYERYLIPLPSEGSV